MTPASTSTAPQTNAKTVQTLSNRFIGDSKSIRRRVCGDDDPAAIAEAINQVVHHRASSVDAIDQAKKSPRHDDPGWSDCHCDSDLIIWNSDLLILK